MDQSISIPVSLVLRSLPVNVEILDLLKSPLNFSNISEIISLIENRIQVQNFLQNNDYLFRIFNETVDFIPKSYNFAATIKNDLNNLTKNKNEK